MTVQKFVDSKGVELVTADFNGNFVVVLEQGTNIEMILCTAITQNGSDNTAILTIDSAGRHLNPQSPWTGGATGIQFTTGASVIVTNDPYTMSRLGNIDFAQTWALLQTFTLAPVFGADAVASNEGVRKSQLDSAVLGSLTNAPVVVPATAGEIVAIDKVVYLKASDSRWYLADADTASNVENVILGVTRGAGTLGGAVTNGVTIYGEHEASSAIFTADTAYFASNTAGEWATSAGTKEVSLGHAHSTTKIYFAPRYDQQLTENQQDLIEQIEAGTDWYASSSVGTDAYAITITPAITAYASGMKFRFKADVANTDACTLAVSGLSALAIKKLNDQDLATGDIEIGQIVEVVYDGTDFQMLSQTAITASPVDVQTFTSSGTYTKPSGATKVFVQICGGGGGGGRGVGDSSGAGGGGGSYMEAMLEASEVGATETVTIGAGGVALTADASGNDGNDSTFGSLLTAYGGKGGVEGGGTDTGGDGGSPYGTVATFWAIGGIGNGAHGIYSGAGAGVNDASTGRVGGDSIYGGAGGGSAGANAGAGGTSKLGGNGGAGASSGNATAGSQPAGGGGGSTGSNSGAGGDGQCIVTTYK